jgi:hypothetical protein
MSDAVLKTREQILTHSTVGRNQIAGTDAAEAEDEGRNQYEKTYRNHRRKASGADHRDAQDFSHRVVRAMRTEGPNGDRRRRITHRPSDPAHDLSLGRKRATAFHRIAGWVAAHLS